MSRRISSKFVAQQTHQVCREFDCNRPPSTLVMRPTGSTPKVTKVENERAITRCTPDPVPFAFCLLPAFCQASTTYPK